MGVVGLVSFRKKRMDSFAEQRSSQEEAQ
jgi:hypothetical protein